MARRKGKRKVQDDTLVDIVEVKEHAEDFIERNQNLILVILFGAVLIIGGIFAYNNFVKKPKESKAVEQMRQAQTQFERDSFALALTNPGGGYDGFLGIIDNFGGTAAGNLANYYAGIAYLNLGDYDNAIKYLKSFSPAGEVLPIMSTGAMADAYSEKGDMKQAVSLYKKAIGQGDNEILTTYYMKKLAMLQESQGDTSGALETYNKIKEEYPTSQTAKEIDKYIARIEAD